MAYCLNDCVCYYVLNFSFVFIKLRASTFVSVFIASKGHICNLKCMNYVLNIGEIMLISVGNTSYLDTINRLTPNDPYMGRTAPLTSKRCILYIYSTNVGTEYF